MKKFLIILISLFVVFNLNAQEPQIKVYLNDGMEKTYRIADVEGMSFTDSVKGSLLTIYQTPQENEKYILTKDISNIAVNEQELTIITEYETMKYQLWTIDSLTVKSIQFEKVIIGNQIWMKRNLDVAHYRNGDEIYQVQTDEEWVQAGEQGIGAWCYYGNDEDNGEIYGKLYNWYAVNDPRGLAPEGWRVPSDDDWKELEMELGMTQEQTDSFSWRGSTVGAKLAGGYDLWISDSLRDHNDFNSSGFSGLPGGGSNPNGYFFNIESSALWWSSTEYSSQNAIYRYLRYNRTNVSRNYHSKGYGFSVRCIRE